GRWADGFDGAGDGSAIEQIDGLPSGLRDAAWRLASRTLPGNEVGPVGREKLEKMAAGESRGARDQNRARHRSGRCQRGTPLIAPLKGEKLPSPASVNDRKKRWSAGMPVNELTPPKLYVWYSNATPQH